MSTARSATEPSRPSDLPDAERLLQRLSSSSRKKSEVRALQLRLSQAPLFQRRPDLLGIAQQAFILETRKVCNAEFILGNGDVVVLGDRDVDIRLQKAAQRLCSLAGWEATAGPEGVSPFVSPFDLTIDDELDALAEMIVKIEKCKPAGRSSPRKLRSQEVPVLCATIRETGVADLVQTQTAVSLKVNSQAPVFLEIYVSLADLVNRHIPNSDLRGSALFSYVLETLDTCVLQYLYPQIQDGALPLSLNLTLNTLRSAEFASFQRVYRRAGPLHVEVHVSEIFAAPAEFESCRQQLAREGIRLVIDGVQLADLDLLDAARFSPDLLKVLWDEARDAPLAGRYAQALRRVVTAIGRDRLLFARVDSEIAIATALCAGVTQMQGRLIERLLSKKAVRR